MNTSLLLDHEPTGSPSCHVVRALLRVEGEAPPSTDRAPLHVALVLDRSGSMAGGKLEAVKDAAIDLVRRLSPDDLVTVVTYDDVVTTVAEPGPGSEQADLTARIQDLRTGGMTNLSGGWLRGRELLAGAAGRPEGAADPEAPAVARILLLTDGLANRGITDRERLCALTAEARSAGITTTTIGFGADYDEVLLRGMADAGGGGTYYIARPDQAVDVFAAEIDGLLELSAQNLTATVTPSEGAELTVVRHSYPSTDLGDALRLEMGDLYAREPRELLCEFGVRVPEDREEVEVASVVLSAHVVTADGGMEHTETTLPIAFSPADGPRVEPEVRRVALLLEAAKLREEVLDDRDRGDYEAASEKLREMAARVEEAADGDPELAEELSEEAADLRSMAGHFEVREVSDADAKYLYHSSHDAMRSQRARRDLYRRKKEPDESDRGS